MTRGALAILASACLTVAGVRAASTRAPDVAQDWRTAAVASFDAAWQAINDTFPDPRFGGVDWPAVARELRPRVEAAGTPDEARDVIREMLARLKRSHFVLLSATADTVLAGPASIPVDVRMLNGEAVVTRVTDTAAGTAGLHAGQVLVSIDDVGVASKIRVAQGSDQRTRDLEAWRHLNQLLSGLEKSEATVSVREVDGSARTLRVTRTMAAGETVTLGNLPPLRVAFEQHEARTPAGHRAGVIAFSLWMTPISDPFEQAIDRFRTADGLVIDLRGNPGGLAAMMRGISGHFIDRPLVLGTMHTRQADVSFTVNPRLVTSDGRAVKPFAGPVALVIDELTGSTSETFAGGLQSLGRVRVFGRPSMGQALPALTKTLPNGDVLMYAVGDFVTSTGKRIEGDGVIPDVLVPLSPTALAAGKDEPVEAALRWLDEAALRKG